MGDVPTRGWMISAALAAALALLPGPLAAQDQDTDGIGVLTLHGSAPAEGSRVRTEAFQVSFQPSPGPDEPVPESRPMTVTAKVGRPDLAVLGWVVGPDHRRHVTLEVLDPAGGGVRTTYELEGATLLDIAISYHGPGPGVQSLTIRAEHLKVNGRAIY